MIASSKAGKLRFWRPGLGSPCGPTGDIGCPVQRQYGPVPVPWKITEFQAQAAGAMGPNQSLQAGSIERTSHEHPSPNYIR
jgi:hypothetical protein